jgi:hypothetical protein
MLDIKVPVPTELFLEHRIHTSSDLFDTIFRVLSLRRRKLKSEAQKEAYGKDRQADRKKGGKAHFRIIISVGGSKGTKLGDPVGKKRK